MICKYCILHQGVDSRICINIHGRTFVKSIYSFVTFVCQLFRKLLEAQEIDGDF